MWLLTISLFCLSMTYGHATDNVAGKIALVTGGARGIGYAMCDNLLLNGAATVIIVDKNVTQGNVAKTALGCQYGEDKVYFYHADITTDMDYVIADALDKFGYIDIVMCNAGVLNEYDIDLTLQTNVVGNVKCAVKFYDIMRQDKNGTGGTIIITSSITGFMIDPFLSIYKASKYALKGLAVGLGHPYNYKYTGVKVMALGPGLTRTEMTAGKMVVDEQETLFEAFGKTVVWQEPDRVGKSAIIILQSGLSGEVYTSEDNKDPEIAPDSRNVTLSELESLLKK